MARLNDPHAVAAFVRQRRKDLKLSQAALAEKVGVTREWVVRLEKVNPRAELGLVLDTLAALKAVPRVLEDDVQSEQDDPFADMWRNL